VALSDSEQNPAALQGLARFSPIVAQYAEVEAIYLEHKDSTTLKEDFRKCLVDLYAKILEYQVTVACHCRRNTLGKKLDISGASSSSNSIL
jgi:hypothetical protein